jgi:hypothetical protein
VKIHSLRRDFLCGSIKNSEARVCVQRAACNPFTIFIRIDTETFFRRARTVRIHHARITQRDGAVQRPIDRALAFRVTLTCLAASAEAPTAAVVPIAARALWTAPLFARRFPDYQKWTGVFYWWSTGAGVFQHRKLSYRPVGRRTVTTDLRPFH